METLQFPFPPPPLPIKLPLLPSNPPMDANPFVFDVSSDDDSPSPPPQTDDDNLEWIRDILDNLNGGGDSDDEVVILGESRNPPNRKPKQQVEANGDDDDCVVLDGDPDGPVRVAADGGGCGGDDEDDLLVVGQKGPVACRDYPHMRHLCIRFPFNSTPHDSHCELCYCYVCDAPAPCARWGSGGSSGGHCHATDKLETWKTLRKTFRLVRSPSLTAPNTMIPGATITQINHIAPAENVFQPIRSSSQSLLTTPIPMHPCSSSSPFEIPSIVRRSRSQQSGLPIRNGLVPHAVSNQALRVHRNLIGKGPNPVGNLHRPVVSTNSRVCFERSRIAGGALVKNRSVHNSSHLRNHAPVSQYARHSASSSIDINIGGQQNVLPGIVSESFGIPTIPVIGANAFGSGSSDMAVCLPNQNVNPIGNQEQHPPVLNVDYNWLLSGYNQDTTSGNCPLSDIGTNNEPPPAELAAASQCLNWFPDQSLPVMSPEYCTPSDMNVFSHEPAAFDPGMLYYDFDTSWHGVTHA